MDDKLSKPFGHVIAFLIPAFVTPWGFSYIVSDVRAWLGTAESASTSVGSFLFVLVASLGLGVFVSGGRFFVFDELLLKHGWLAVPPAVEDKDEARRPEEKKQSAYEDLRDQFYRFYQFYANTAVALALSFGAWVATGGAATIPKWAVAFAFIVGEVVLVASARDSITKFRNKKRALLSVSPPASGGEGSQRDERRRGPKGSPQGSATSEADAGQAPSVQAATAAPSSQEALIPIARPNDDQRR